MWNMSKIVKTHKSMAPKALFGTPNTTAFLKFIFEELRPSGLRVGFPSLRSPSSNQPIGLQY